MNRQRLLDFLQNDLGLDVSAVEDDTPLFSGGLLDSFSLVDLILFIEGETKSKVDPSDVRLDHMDSIARILSFAEGRGGVEGAA